MSCGQNHKYDAYQKASDALKAALVEALNTDEETSTLEELFEHYIGARKRADKAANSYSIYGGDSVIDFGDGYPIVGSLIAFAGTMLWLRGIRIGSMVSIGIE